MASFGEILSKQSVFKNINVLSPHYIPQQLLFREQQIEQVMSVVSPALKSQKPRNLFIYGKTGTGKTCTVKHVMDQFNTHSETASMCYINCRIYNSRYRILQKLIKQYLPNLDKAGFGLPYLYEKMIEHLGKGFQVVIVLDEIDMIKDLDELIYTLTRVNDEITNGGLTIVGISNRLSFKNELDPRSKSSLYETEMVFPPYTSIQLQSILNQRISEGFNDGVVDPSAINLTAAITAQDSGDARYALKLLMKAGELTEQNKNQKITDKEVELARKKVEVDILQETLSTLPEHHQLALLGVANLSVSGGSQYARLDGTNDFEGYLFSGEVYNEYMNLCTKASRKPRSSRWFKEYISDLEMLGLVTSKMSSKGVRGHTTLIKAGQEPKDVIKFLERAVFR